MVPVRCNPCHGMCWNRVAMSRAAPWKTRLRMVVDVARRMVMVMVVVGKGEEERKQVNWKEKTIRRVGTRVRKRAGETKVGQWPGHVEKNGAQRARHRHTVLLIATSTQPPPSARLYPFRKRFAMLRPPRPRPMFLVFSRFRLLSTPSQPPRLQS
ncbi:hypothetical protein V1478_011063 [Vespula squamosa]|uniref:Uncharacterized protein n=1 Tax=Vespula squamosa TaxID=30214 RepID=A0ABD2AGT5_VESSQ